MMGSDEWILSTKKKIRDDIKLSKQMFKIIDKHLDQLSIEELHIVVDDLQDIRIDIEGLIS